MPTEQHKKMRTERLSKSMLHTLHRETLVNRVAATGSSTGASDEAVDASALRVTPEAHAAIAEAAQAHIRRMVRLLSISARHRSTLAQVTLRAQEAQGKVQSDTEERGKAAFKEKRRAQIEIEVREQRHARNKKKSRANKRKRDAEPEIDIDGDPTASASQEAQEDKEVEKEVHGQWEQEWEEMENKIYLEQQHEVRLRECQEPALGIESGGRESRQVKCVDVLALLESRSGVVTKGRHFARSHAPAASRQAVMSNVVSETAAARPPTQ